MQLIFAAGIGDLERVRSLVLSCDDRIAAQDLGVVPGVHGSANDNYDEEKQVDEEEEAELRRRSFEEAKLRLVNMQDAKVSYAKWRN